MIAALPCLVLLSALLVWRMIRRGTVDVPGLRSSHQQPTPKGGGVGIAIATLFGLAGAGAAGWSCPARPIAGVVVAGTLLATVAHADDRLQFGFVWKLAAQLAAALTLVATGSVLARFGPFALGWAGPFVTVAIVLVFTNATNFMDGLNGLAAGCGLVAAIAIGGRAWLLHDHLVASAALPLAAGLLGFLPFNFPRARIFMGDVGSQFLGLILAVLAIDGGSLLPGGVGPGLAPLIAFPLLFDVAFTLARRALNGDRLPEAHRSHLYQLAHRSGVPAPIVTLIHWGLSLVGTTAVFVPTAWPSVLMASTAGVAIWAAAALLIARRAPIGPW